MRSKLLLPRHALFLCQILFWAVSAPINAFAQPISKYDTLECTVRSRADYYEHGLPNLSVMGRYYIGDTFVLRLFTGEMQWRWAPDADRFDTVQKVEDGNGRVFLGVNIRNSTRTISVLQVLDPWDNVYPFLLLEGSDFMTGDCKVTKRLPER